MPDRILPLHKMPVVCCRVGDPKWNETPDSLLQECEACEFPVHITPATLKKVEESPNSFIICVQCARRHFDQTGQKFAPLTPTPEQRAEGTEWQSNLHHAICQLWYESEKGWGWRPDGFSLHLTEEDRLAYITDYWEGMPPEAPDEYSKETGKPFNVGVPPGIFEILQQARNGVRSYKSWPEPSTIVREL